MKDNFKKVVYRFKKGYDRPVSLPIWKWLIVYLSWGLTLFFYISTIIGNTWLIIFALCFQMLSMYLPNKWDTGSWKTSNIGKAYKDKYK